MKEELLSSLYGSCIKNEHCIGYCKYHKCHLSVAQLKRHECLRKQCKALEKREHEYWKQRELIKMAKKQNKNHWHDSQIKIKQ